jgi:hypothetical protein
MGDHTVMPELYVKFYNLNSTKNLQSLFKTANMSAYCWLWSKI